MDTIPASPAFLTGTEALRGSVASPAICSASGPCRLDGTELVVGPFRMSRFGQTYINPNEIRIDLAAIASGRYRVIAVHNFHVEDGNPRLDECVAGLFLAAQRDDGSWEEPERFPVECRAVGMLASLQVSEDGAAAELST